MDTPKLSYVHLRSTDDPHHTVTSVGYYIANGKLYVQIARCRAPDNWSRRIAHNIIAGRFKKRGPLTEYDTSMLQHFSVGELLASEFHPDFGETAVDASFELGAC